MTRNVVIVVGAVIAGIIVMQPFMLAEQYATEGRVFHGVIGTLLLHVIVLVPRLAAAGAMGSIAGLFVRTSRPGAWAATIATIVASLLILSQRYVAPDWVAWLTTIFGIALPSALAGSLFNMVRRRRNRSLPVV